MLNSHGAISIVAQSPPPRKRKGGNAFVRAIYFIAALAFVGFSATALASGIYVSQNSGYDISWAQCGGAYPAAPYAFGIVNVNRGRAFTQNPCLASEYKWATQATTSAPSLYINLNYPVGSTASNGLSGPLGTCKRNDQACQAYNYGYNAAQYSFQYASAQSAIAATWWLDIETSNSWSKDRSLNARVIEGAIKFLQSQNLILGIYSTARQWNIIAGTYAPGLPNWVAGASSALLAPSFCSSSYAFGGGTVFLVQYPSGSYSGDYAC